MGMCPKPETTHTEYPHGHCERTQDNFCVHVVSHFSCVWLFVTLWTIVHQVPLSMGFFRQEYCSGLPCPSPEDLPTAGIKPTSLMSPTLAGGFFITSATWEAQDKFVRAELRTLVEKTLSLSLMWTKRHVALAVECSNQASLKENSLRILKMRAKIIKKKYN